jgi:hypothetical protein
MTDGGTLVSDKEWTVFHGVKISLAVYEFVTTQVMDGRANSYLSL